MKYIYWFLAIILSSCTSPDFYVCAPDDNNLLTVLQQEGKTIQKYSSLEAAVGAAPHGASVLLLAEGYPDKPKQIERALVDEIKSKDLRVYAEFVTFADTVCKPITLSLERAVVVDSAFSHHLPMMELLTINGSYVLPEKHDHTILAVAKVAGMEKAVYGLEDTPYYSLLYRYDDQILVSTSALSHFADGRFSPQHNWKAVWNGILSFLAKQPITLRSWLSYVNSAYGRKDILDSDARKHSIEKGIEWFYNGHFLVEDSWKKDWVDNNNGGDGTPLTSPLPRTAKDGDGSLGVIQGHCSSIYWDGSQQYTYWMRNDVQGESSMAFSLAGKFLNSPDYYKVASNLMDHALDEYRDGPRSDPRSPSFGLLGWALTHKGHYYQDDNARSILGMLATASITNQKQWDKKILEAIVGNFRTTGKNGFRGSLLFEEKLQEYGWKHYWNGDLINPHPHLESWIWACYLYLYSKTGYEELLTRTKKAIQLTMEAYPTGWQWTNGIQQERARMILPLAWLARIEPTEQHLNWLNFMIDEVLKNQVECGAIREELGEPSTGWYNKTKSNEEYGKFEAPLIHDNGDPVADMLYTSNFAFFALNEAAFVTGKPEHKAAVQKLSDFLIRIQVRSEKFKDVDGAWFRAFNYDKWDYWGSNADAGWGAWCTLTGWIQSWIVTTQIMLEMNTTLWDIIQTHDIETEWVMVKKEMLTE